MGSSFTSYCLDDISAAAHAFNSGRVCGAKVAKYGIGGPNCGRNEASCRCDSGAIFTQYFKLQQKESNSFLLSIVENIGMFSEAGFVRRRFAMTQSKGD